MNLHGTRPIRLSNSDPSEPVLGISGQYFGCFRCFGKFGPGDVTHERALSPADLFGGKAPVGALIGRIC
jgi:hypothetical protein